MCIAHLIYADTLSSITTQEQTQEFTKNQSLIDESATNIADRKISFFDTAKVSDDTYAAFMVGYEMLQKSMNGIREQKQGMYFELDRGFLFVDDIILFGFSLDGTAGGFYSININTKLGARIFDGRVIPSISFGYGLLNHSLGTEQYNLHGASATISLFVDIASGFGLEAGYRVGLYPFRATQRRDIKVNNIGAFMINFKFVDFSI